MNTLNFKQSLDSTHAGDRSHGAPILADQGACELAAPRKGFLRAQRRLSGRRLSLRSDDAYRPFRIY